MVHDLLRRSGLARARRPLVTRVPGPARDRLRAELDARSRNSAIVVVVLAVLISGGWTVLDSVLEPAHFTELATARTGITVVLLACLWALVRRPAARLDPGALAFVGLAGIQVATALMIVRLQHVEFYLLGFSLALHASGTLLVARPRWTVALVGTSWAALGLSLATAPGPLAGRTLAAVLFFTGVTSLVALVVHGRRWPLLVDQLAARIALEDEQQRTRELLDRLERLSMEDPLTGLANRRRWDAELAGACADARTSGGRLAVVLVDVDHFKLVNDRYGHAGGDAALQAVAALLSARVREGDLVARVGGDEIAVLLRGADAGRAAALAEGVRLAAHALHPEALSTAGLSLSLGVAAASGADADPRQLLAAADAQLYRAKETRDAVAVG